MIAMPNPEEDYSFDLEKILANPPVLVALRLLGMQKQEIARRAGYSNGMVSGWISGKKRLTFAQAEALINIAIAIMNMLNASGDLLSRLPKPAREKLVFRIRAAHAAVALQRYISLGYDFCAQDDEFWRENMAFAEAGRNRK